MVTGVLESLERDKAVTIIKDYGGKVVTTVGKKLNYLIAGEESGPKKLAVAEELGIPIIDENGFLDMIRERSDENKVVAKLNVKERNCVGSNVNKTVSQSAKDIKVKKEQKTDEIESKVYVKREKYVDLKQEKQAVEKEETIAVQGNSAAWVDKYKPNSLKDIIGQQGSASNCTKYVMIFKFHVTEL